MADIKYKLSLSANSALKTLKNTKKQLNDTHKQAKKTGKSFTALKAAITGASAALAVNFVKNNIAAADALGKVANKTGFAISALQEIRYAAELAGMSAMQLDTSLQRFSRRVGEASNGSGVLAKDLEALGIEFKNQDGSMRDINSVFMDYMTAIAGASSEQEKLRLAVAAFDMEGAQMVNMLTDGIGGFREWRKEARALGIIVDESTIQTATEANDAWLKVRKQFEAISIEVAGKLAPKIKEISESLSGWAANEKNIQKLADSIEGFGVALSRIVENIKGLAIAFGTLKILDQMKAWRGLAEVLRGNWTVKLANMGGWFMKVGKWARLAVAPLALFAGKAALIATAIWGIYEGVKWLLTTEDDLKNTATDIKQITAELDKTQSVIGRFKHVKLKDLIDTTPPDIDTETLDFFRNLLKDPIKVDTAEIKELKKEMKELEGVIDPSIKLWDDYNKQVARVIEASNKGVINKEKASEFISYLQDEYVKAANALEFMDDEADEQVEKAKTWAEGWTDAFKEYKEAAFDAADNARTIFNSVAQSMEDAIFNFAQTGKLNFKSFAQSVINDMLRIQSKQLASKIMGGNLFGKEGGLFSGFFAGGGIIPQGRYGIAGEAGPEIVRGPAEITPMQPGNITYNINAVDAPSFQSLIAQDPEFIFAVTEQGRQSLPRFA